MPTITRMPDGRWRTTKQINNKRVFIKSRSRVEVERKLGEALQRKPVQPGQTGATFADVVAAFLADKEAKARDGSFRHYKHHVLKVGGCASYFKDRPLRQITIQDYNDFLDLRLSTPSRRGPSDPEKRKLRPVNLLSKQTVHHERAILVQIHEFAALKGYIPAPIATSKNLNKIKPDEVSPRILSSQELVAIFRVCPKEFRPLLDLFLQTGLRLSEMQRLDWSNIDLVNEALTLRGNQTKNRKVDTIPMSKTLVETLKRLKVKTGPVVEPNFGPILEGGSTARFYTILKKIAREAGIRRFGLHALRHTFITNVLRATKNPYAAERLARHKDPKMTRRYIHIVAEELRDDIGLFDAYSKKAKRGGS